MTTLRHEITGRNYEHEFQTAGPDQFTCAPGRPIDPQAVLENPNITLYCLDPREKQAVFVETPEGVDVTHAPFMYIAQRRHAVAVVSVPFNRFHRLAEAVTLNDVQMVWVHSVGRCGSTLLSKALEAVPEVYSLPEPDVLTQLLELRPMDRSGDAEVSALIRSSVLCLFKHRPDRPRPRFFAIKPRSQVMELADLIYNEFPQSRNLFLYRDGLSWLTSVFRAFLHDLPIEDELFCRDMATYFVMIHKLVADEYDDAKPMSQAKLWILGWVSIMERYLELHARGVPFCAARFEDLKRDPRGIVGALFEYCGIRLGDMGPVHDALRRDSQEGSRVAQENVKQASYQMPQKYLDEAAAIIASRPMLTGPGMRVPDTLACGDEVGSV